MIRADSAISRKVVATEGLLLRYTRVGKDSALESQIGIAAKSFMHGFYIYEL